MKKIIQFTGLSGAGKTTIANALKAKLTFLGKTVLIIDGDEFRKKFCSDLAFDYKDRLENISRISKYANEQITQYDLIIISAINPFAETREILKKTCNADLFYIKCDIKTLTNRDTKGLYKRTMLPTDHADYLGNLTGVNDRFDDPEEQLLTIDTSNTTVNQAVEKIKTKLNSL